VEIREEYTEPSLQPAVETTKTNNDMATTTSMQGANSYNSVVDYIDAIFNGSTITFGTDRCLSKKLFIINDGSVPRNGVSLCGLTIESSEAFEIGA